MLRIDKAIVIPIKGVLSNCLFYSVVKQNGLKKGLCFMNRVVTSFGLSFFPFFFFNLFFFFDVVLFSVYKREKLVQA